MLFADSPINFFNRRQCLQGKEIKTFYRTAYGQSRIVSQEFYQTAYACEEKKQEKYNYKVRLIDVVDDGGAGEKRHDNHDARPRQ